MKNVRTPRKSGKVLRQIEIQPYFLGSNFVLYKNDAIAFLTQLSPNSIDTIFADPPYNLSNGGFSVHAGKRVSVNKGTWDESRGFEEDMEFHKRWIQECYRVLKPNGTIWISGTYHSIYQCGFALQLSGYKILNDITWFKPNASPNLSGRYFTASHETLLWARKDPAGKHTFNYQDMKNGEWHKDDLIKKDGKQMRSVWSITTPKPNEKKFGKHPTQKPMALLERVILASTLPGEVVLDPFTGSSTTGIAAAKHGRKFIGLDLETEFLDLSVKRYKDHFSK
jgi:site-specific DNA-methyltransferase (adenine-specific)